MFPRAWRGCFRGEWRRVESRMGCHVSKFRVTGLAFLNTPLEVLVPGVMSI